MKKLLTLFLTMILSACMTNAQNVQVEPKGEFASINNKETIDTIKVIQSNNSHIIDKIVTNSEIYAPPVFYALSKALFDSGKKQEAMFWFYAGQLRARGDANKSLDVSAKQAVSVLNMNYGKEINKYSFSNLESLKKTVNEVVAWDKKTARDYDPRWIALHGMDAFTKTTIRFSPQAEWESINIKTREDYLKSFNKAIKMMKKKG